MTVQCKKLRRTNTLALRNSAHTLKGKTAMCQIIFSPQGKLCNFADFREANNDNNDGIGVMSAAGVQKFFGKRQMRRAWEYVNILADNGYAWAVHFRYGTAGLRDRSNVHPFTSECGVHWMHNGVFRQSELYDRENRKSDTAMLVELMLGAVSDPSKIVDLLEMSVGSYNKLLAYAPALDQWTLINENSGDWDAGIWFSNEYSRANWSAKYGMYGGGEYCAAGSSTASQYTGYLYDAEAHELTRINADGTRGESFKATDRGEGIVCGVSANGVTVAGRFPLLTGPEAAAQEAARKHKESERMALMQATRSDAPATFERLADCVTCASLELKTCLCSRGNATPAEIDLALEALDRRMAAEDAAASDNTVTLSDPRAIQERIDAYLASESEDDLERGSDMFG
jgi:hypothetical protein